MSASVEDQILASHAPAKPTAAPSEASSAELEEILAKMESGDYYIKVGKPQQVLSAVKRGKGLIYVQGAASKKRRRSSKDGKLPAGTPRKLHPYNLYMKTRVKEIKDQTGIKHPQAFKQAAKEWKDVESKKSKTDEVSGEEPDKDVASDSAPVAAMETSSAPTPIAVEPVHAAPVKPVEVKKESKTAAATKKRRA